MRPLTKPPSRGASVGNSPAGGSRRQTMDVMWPPIPTVDPSACWMLLHIWPVVCDPPIYYATKRYIVMYMYILGYILLYNTHIKLKKKKQFSLTDFCFTRWGVLWSLLSPSHSSQPHLLPSTCSLCLTLGLGFEALLTGVGLILCISLNIPLSTAPQQSSCEHPPSHILYHPVADWLDLGLFLSVWLLLLVWSCCTSLDSSPSVSPHQVESVLLAIPFPIQFLVVLGPGTCFQG